nr:two-component regulator propeller domain-containing protein [Haliscomenobacter sp.]
MERYLNNAALLFRFLFLLLVFGSCDTAPRNIPFPTSDASYSQPTTGKLRFSEPQKLSWITMHPDSVQVVESKFDLNKIPSKPIALGNPAPLSIPMEDHPFDLAHMPDTVFNLDKIPSHKLTFKTVMLGQPKRVKSGFPRIKDGASENLFQFGLDQGLSGTVYTAFAQDKNGALWIGTDVGLCSFDGEYCETYSVAQGLSPSLVKNFLVDRQGQKWIRYGDQLGISVLNERTGTIKHLSTAGGLSNKRVWALMEDNKGRIWVGTEEGVNVIDPKTDSVKYITKTQGLRGNDVYGPIFQDSRGRIWVGVFEKGIDLIDEKTGTVKHIAPQHGLGNGLNELIQDLSEDKSGRMWLGTWGGGVRMIDERAGRIKSLTTAQGLGNDRIISFAFDEKGSAWIGTYGTGVDVFDTKAQTIKHLRTAQGLNNDIVLSVFADKQHQIWIGTEGGEANVYNTAAGNIHHLSSRNGLNNGSAFYFGFAQDSQARIWVGSLGGGVDVLDEKAGTLKNITSTNGLLYPDITFLLTDSRGRIWVNSSRRAPHLSAVEVIDEEKRSIKSFKSNKGLSILNGGGIIVEDKEGQIWTNSIYGGLYVLNEKTNTIKYAKEVQGISSDVVQYLLKDRKGQIWVATAKGLDIINETAGTIKQASFKGVTDLGFSNLIEDQQGNIWIATNAKGLIMLDQNAGTSTTFTLDSGLPDMTVNSLNEKNGTIYAGTGLGLAVITPINTLPGKSKQTTSWQIKTYGKAQGFLRVDHNPRSLLTKDGRFWFGIADVLTIMEAPENDTLHTSTFIVQLDVMGRPHPFLNNKQIQSHLPPMDTLWSTTNDTFYTKNTPLADTGYLQQNNITWDSTSGPHNLPVNLRLPHHQNFLTFHFTGTHLDNTNKTRYRYILEGADKAWSEISDKSYAEFRNLLFGQYTFKVCSRGFNGRWSQPATFSFTILPPWYRSTWAYIVYGLLFMAAVVMLDRIQRRRLLKQAHDKAKDRELAQAKEIEKAYTELRSTQVQLIQSEKLASLGELTAGIAHEIQNPLNFVNNFSEVSAELLDEMTEEIEKGDTEEVKAIAADLKQNLQKINHHGQRASSIVKGMLEHSRASTGVKEL